MPRNKEYKGLKRRYDEEFKTSVLNSLNTVCNGNIAAAARLHDVPRGTLRDWALFPDMTVIGTGCTTQLEP